ncbi:SDR family NAD(P)-dependent oxidoreductase [Streptomyces sp. NPDC059037]|uniref:SDR family NAD(P)-dependent oxidoreductase n=1 Tax=Streptomyces sp. NPDC059037 TaxID=3346710 RepID=UPI0036C9AA5A
MVVPPGSAAADAAAVASGEPQVAVRDGQVFAPRLVRSTAQTLTLPDAPQWRLATTGDGGTDGLAVTAEPAPAGPLGPQEIRVSMRAAGIARDDLTAGTGTPGTGGAGVVTEAGAAVTGVAVGDRVWGVFPQGGALGRAAVTDHRSVARVPRGATFAEAAALPRAFLTAWHALVDEAELRSGQRVLIHSGGDAIGLAAVQIARHLGAEVFATAPRTAWDTLRDSGLDAAHIAEPEAGDIVRKVPTGLDVILAQEGSGRDADASAALLAEGGRFVAVGTGPVTGAGTGSAVGAGTGAVSASATGADWAPAIGGVPASATGADSATTAGADPTPTPTPTTASGPTPPAAIDTARQQAVIAELGGLFATGVLRPVPVTAYDMRAAADAYRRLGEGGRTGGSVLTLPRPLDREGTVVVTGASGTLGRLVLRRLVSEHGVRNVLLLSRSGGDAPSDLVDSGVRVDSVACDVADREQLARALARIPAEHPPTAVVHTAGVLDDGVLEALTPERLATVLRPKADAVDALHELTADADLAAFVVFSSVAGVLGSAGQANYAAANAYLDAFAARRHAAGRPAVSIAWGMWTQSSTMTAGLGTADLGRIARTGLLPTATDEGLAAFDRALAGALPNVVPVRVDTAALRAAESVPPLLRDLAPAPNRRAAAGVTAARDESLESRLRGLPAEQRRALLLDLVLTDVALVLGHSDPRGVSAEGAFRDLGFDSLTAVELRNRINNRTGVKLSATAVFDHPSPLALVDHLLGRIAPAPADPRDTEEPDYERVMADLTRIRSHLAALELTGAQRAALAETVRGMSEPWANGESMARAAGDPAPAALESASAAEVLDFVTNSLGISISGDASTGDATDGDTSTGDASPTDPS